MKAPIEFYGYQAFLEVDAEVLFEDDEGNWTRALVPLKLEALAGEPVLVPDWSIAIDAVHAIEERGRAFRAAPARPLQVPRP